MPKATEPLTVLGLNAAKKTARKTGTRAELRDQTTRGLVAFVQADGRVTFGLRYSHEGQRRRMNLGAWQATPAASGITLEDARKKAGELIQQGDPKAEAAKRAAQRAEEKAQQERTLAKVAEAWLASPEAKAWRSSTRREFVRVVRREIVPALGGLDPNAPTTPAEAARLIRRIAEGRPREHSSKHPAKRGKRPQRSEPAPVMANRVLAILRALYRWALLEEHRAHGVRVDATAGLKRPHIEDAVPRVFTTAEIRAMFEGAEQMPELRDVVPFLALTMARLGEAFGARLREFDFTERVWTIPAERSKDGRPHVVPLTKRCAERIKSICDSRRVVPIGDSDALFPNAGLAVSSDVRVRWRALSGVADANFHPWRDTAVAWLREAGYSSDVREDLLSHTPTKLQRAYGGEYRTSLPQRRAALEAWGDRLAAIFGGKAETQEQQA